MINYYFDAIKKYAVFSGRATVLEFWQFVLFNMLFSAFFYGLDKYLLNAPGYHLSYLYNIFIFLPSLAVTTRRLRDTNRSIWWILIAGIPIFGAIALIAILMAESQGARKT